MAHQYLRKCLMLYAVDIYYKDLFRVSKERKEKCEKAGMTQHYSAIISAPKMPIEDEHSSESNSQETMNLNLIDIAIQNFINDNNFYDYSMVLFLLEDQFNIDLNENLEMLNVDIFKYIYDFIYLNEDSNGENEKVLKVLKKEEIQEFLFNTSYTIPNDFLMNNNNK